MESGEADIIWTQFILAAALTRVAHRVAETHDEEAEAPRFSYADTHAGGGRLLPPALLPAVLAHRGEFHSRSWLDAVVAGKSYPGSWVLAGRVINALGGLDFEADVNDIDLGVIEAAKGNREGGWVRFWSHDWFSFLRHRFVLEPRPHFVFIDPPPDDPRGPGYAMDAAILLDTLDTPYMVSYPVDHTSQNVIDQIGRSGLELRGGGLGRGVLLGGGAETVVLDILADLRLLAGLLGGELSVRLPRAPVDDYCI
ncbi:hypothetical protein CCC_01020 [Paramagnetospirillum magnetotacticum MS-1]|uniref:Uncharacterized protein n=1 Tax=Paramagnetospirillum magnetotacticum MS-1 TaxID=272627 RepID=A0A0C2YE29_PARME|nr:hypothetical protein [Paramagnetospirillum magnetotacticum]KIL97959.1 hypothetical protein CCC_01020 [Paramagnetospirillum magnetotacticum MS-1]